MAIDQSLKSFHQAVDVTARQAQRLILTLDNGAGGISALSLGDKLRRISGALAPS